MASFKVDVEPDVIRWARESLGLSPIEAAQKLNLSPLDLRYFEEGADSPTLGQLRNMAAVYKRPLAVFFLAHPPKDFDAMKDFRHLTGTQRAAYSPSLILDFRRIHQQRAVAIDLAERAHNTPDPLDVTLTLDMDAERAGQAIRSWLHVPALAMDLKQWIDLVEDKAILVAQVKGIAMQEMRGCSISEQPFPVIVLNGKDAPRGRIFTLLHEVGHVLLRAGGLCGIVQLPSNAPNDQEKIERFCNRVAAAALMPRAWVLSNAYVKATSPTTRWPDNTLRDLANEFGVSREALLIRLIELGRASWDYYFEKQPTFTDEYEGYNGEGKPPYYRMKIRDLGRRYITTVLDAYHRDDITCSDLSSFLNIKLDNLSKLEHELGRQARI